MTRIEFARLISAVARVTDLRQFLIVGSQAILASYDEAQLPAEATMSNEIDAAVSGHPQAAAVNRLLGPGSLNGRETGLWVDVVSERTADLPVGWLTRTVHFESAESMPGSAYCPEPHDLALSKLAAFRLQDKIYASAMIRAKPPILDLDVLDDRVEDLITVPIARRLEIKSWLAAERKRIGR